jgi:hypothetical protein
MRAPALAVIKAPYHQSPPETESLNGSLACLQMNNHYNKTYCGSVHRTAEQFASQRPWSNGQRAYS